MGPARWLRQCLQLDKSGWLSLRDLVARKKFSYASLMWALRRDRGKRFMVVGGQGDHLIAAVDDQPFFVLILDGEEEAY